MQFASFSYMLFLALAVAIYFVLPGRRARSVWLLAASYFFYYTLSAPWTLVLLGVTLIGYLTGRLLERIPAESMRARKALLIGGIITVVGVLFVFKYAGFAGQALDGILALVGSTVRSPVLELALPVGVSFWTFQTIAYLVDVYRGTIAAERDLLTYGVFIAFFPHVAAGPIARGGQLLPQLSEVRRFSFESMRSGLVLMLWGFIKKTMVADRMGVFVGSVFADPRAYSDSGIVLAAAAVGFAVQIYCDFSGYTDIARGAARIFGIDLLPNFDRPYAARSVKEFWRRWHMSLMGWLKDYIYIPLGGSRVSKLRRYGNILAVFALSGLWHGAGWTFIIWGLLNGAYQILGELLGPARERVWRALRVSPESVPRRVVQTATTFVLITIGWVFFRAGSLSDALYIISKMFVPTAGFLADLKAFDIGLTRPEVLLTAIMTVVIFVIDYVSSRIDIPSRIYRAPLPVRWAVYQGATLMVLVFGHFGPTLKSADFVYFKF